MRWVGVALAAVLLLNPTYQWLMWEFFHPDALSIAPLLFAYWAARERRWGWFAVAGGLAIACKEDVALEPRQFVKVLGRFLVAFVFLQSAHEFGTRVVLFFLVRFGARQQHARLDLGQHGGHQQILARQFELHLLHEFDVLHVLPGDFRDRDIEDVNVLPPYQVQQQIEGALESLEKHLQCVRRYVQVLRQSRYRLAVDDRKWHFSLRW